MQPLDIIQMPFAIIMITPLVILTLGLIGVTCWLAGISYQKYAWNKEDELCDLHDSILYEYLDKERKAKERRIQALLSGIKQNVYPIQPVKVGFYKITNTWLSRIGMSNNKIRVLG